MDVSRHGCPEEYETIPLAILLSLQVAANLGFSHAVSWWANEVASALFHAARTVEVRGAVWAEFDLEGAVWTIPAPRMKAGW